VRAVALPSGSVVGPSGFAKAPETRVAALSICQMTTRPLLALRHTMSFVQLVAALPL
jgi:hypothetical protein